MDESQDYSSESQSIGVTALVVLYGTCLGLGLFRILTVEPAKPQHSKSPHLLTIKSAENEPTIAVVPIYGAIAVGQDGPFASNNADRITKRLKSLSERKNVKAVVLRINSPGGSVGAVQEIYDEVTRLKASGIKVVASMGDVAASGGYYIAAGADTIYANPGTITGSIGVIFQLSNVQDLLKKIGLKMDPLKSAKHKDIGSPFRTTSPEERKILQSIIDDAYRQFVQAIVSGRNMQEARVRFLADGRIYSGSQAKTQGLVDELGNLEAAIARAGELAGIKGKPRVFYEDDPWERFFSSFSQSLGFKFPNPIGDAAGMKLAYLWEYEW